MSVELTGIVPRVEESTDTNATPAGAYSQIGPEVETGQKAEAETSTDTSISMETKYHLVDDNGRPLDSKVDHSQWKEDYRPREPSGPPSHQGEPPVSVKAHLQSMWYLVVIFLTPIVMLPIIMLVDDTFQRQARCGYIIAIMAVYWTTEALPIAVTSLLPIFLLPVLGVMRARDTSEAYFNDTSMLFLGGLMVAIAIEVWDVHKRIALLTLRLFGAEPKCLLLGIAVVTWFLSMWISNTATTAMMMTIVQALLQQFKDVYRLQRSNVTPMTTTDGSAEAQAQPEMTEAAAKEFKRLSKALSLTVAYAANIGGVASMTGTGPNLVLVSNIRRLYEEKHLDSPITFGTWLIYGFPLSLLVLVIMWMWMILYFLRSRISWACLFRCRRHSPKDEGTELVNDVIRDEYNKLGPVSYAQKTVLLVFFLLVAMWVSRDLGGSGGWGKLFAEKMVSDSTPSIFFAVLMFILPATFPANVFFTGKRGSLKRIEPLLKWTQVNEKMPWSLYLLLGGGYAIARAATESGLSTWLGDQLLVFGHLDSNVFLLIICYIVTFATEVTSNTAIATLMMPILAQMAISLQVNPLFYMYPATIATSFAFMLPVATPPNAIVISSGAVRVFDMIKCGLVLNIVGVPLILLATVTWGDAYFQFGTVPVEFLSNSTSTATTLAL